MSLIKINLMLVEVIKKIYYVDFEEAKMLAIK